MGVLLITLGSLYLCSVILMWLIGLPFAAMTTDGGKFAFFLIGWPLMCLFWPIAIPAAALNGKIKGY
jgi:hypothetical protein